MILLVVLTTDYGTGWNLDIETRCMQEVVDAGEVRILQQQKRKKWWRGQWGKSTYETKWMQEIERHLGGRESSILKQDERKKLLRDMPPPTFCPPFSSTGWVRAHPGLEFESRTWKPGPKPCKVNQHVISMWKLSNMCSPKRFQIRIIFPH